MPWMLTFHLISHPFNVILMMLLMMQFKVKGRTRFITLADLDGRSRAARNARDIAAAMTADLGGEQNLTEAQRQLIRRAATLGSLIEDFEARFLAGAQLDDLPKYLSAITTQRHVLSLLGLERRARDATPNLQKFLAALPDKAKSAS